MHKIVLFTMAALLLAGCTASAGQSPESDPNNGNASLPGLSLPDLGPAPELNNEIWLNTEQPLRLEDLRDKVVLLDMWTFG